MANTENEKLDKEPTQCDASTPSNSAKPEAVVTETCRAPDVETNQSIVSDDTSFASPLSNQDTRDVTIPSVDQSVTESGEEDDEVSKIMLDGHQKLVPKTDDVGDDDVILTDDDVIVTEVIMSKTFTESIAPDQEFIPIGDVLSVVDQMTSESDSASSAMHRKSPASGVADVIVVSDEATHDGRDRAVADAEDAGSVVQLAGAQVRDLAGEFYRLLGLLDNLSNPLQPRTDNLADDDDFSSSDEHIDHDGDCASGVDQTRVVYKYRVRATSGRRWIRRPRVDGDPADGNETIPEAVPASDSPAS